MTNDTPSNFTIKGWHVLAAFIAFFAVGITVNTIFVVQAVQTFRGEEVERSYMQGLAYNDVLDARAAQAELGWTARVNLEDDQLLLLIVTETGEPVQALTWTGQLEHRADMDMDRDIILSDRGEGVYVADLSDVPSGNWRLTASAQSEPPFTLEHEFWRP